VNASGGIFDGADDITITNRHILVTGCRIQLIDKILPIPGGREFVELLQERTSKRSVYVTGIPYVRALCCTFMRTTNVELDLWPVLARVQGPGVYGFPVLKERLEQAMLPEHFGRSLADGIWDYAANWNRPHYRPNADHINSEVFFEAKDGYVGLAPTGAKAGDTLCILQGCSHPMLLRTVDDHEIVVGPCFVLGLMDGEAKAIIERGDSKIEVFELH